MNQYPVLSRILIIFVDTVITVLSYFVAMQLRAYLGLSGDLEWRYYVNLLLIIMIIWGGLLEYQEAYAGRAYKSGISLGASKSLKKEVLIVLRTVLFGCPLVYIISYVINIFFPWEVPKSLVIIFAVVNIVMLSLEKFIIYHYGNYERKKNKNLKRVIILGTGYVAKQFIDSIDKNVVNIRGLVGKEPCEEGSMLFGYKVMGCYDNLVGIIHANYVDELVIALPAKYLGDIEDIIARCDREGIPVRIVSPFFKNLISKSRAEVIGGLPNIMFLPVERNDLELVIKRIIDIVFSAAFIILLSPVFLVIPLLIKLDSEGPVFYRWKILGLHKRPLTSYKFRTMVQDADIMKNKLANKNEMNGIAFKIKGDPRITKVGKWLRKFSLDEVPQLWSVLKGDLSLVGPRPPLQTEVEQYEGWHRRKLSVKPGLTCLWQIQGRNRITDFNEWMRLDLEYIDEWTLWLDLKILFKTIPAVIKGTGM